MASSILSMARAALDAGDLRLADSLFVDAQQLDQSARALRAEVLFVRGQTAAALRLAGDLLARIEQKAPEYAHLLFISGACSWELGDERKGVEQLQAAIAHARVADDRSLQARAKLQILERSVDSGAAYHASLPLCAETVRSVHRSGDKIVLADAHITFARLEARTGGILSSRRHLGHAERILRDNPNTVLRASAHLTHSIVLSVEGDIESASEVAEAARLEAISAGWTKGEAIAAANLAFFALCGGNLAAAEDNLRRAQQAGYHSPSYDYALRDTQIALAVVKNDFSEADRLWTDGQSQLRGVAAWYKLRGAHTRVRSLIRQNRLNDALSLARRNLSEAGELENDFFKYVFQLNVAEIESGLGKTSLPPLELWSPADSSLGLIGARRRAIAKALARGDEARAYWEAEAAQRILAAGGSQFEWSDQDNGTPKAFTDSASLPSAGVLDEAIALLELAGYPHVLAREAYALLDVTGSAAALALIARGERGVRCVTASGWTEAEAIAAAAEPGERLRIVCGVHRDETWEILADLKPTLNDRCAGVAVRKLVDTAVTLDRYRREEKQRAALWPADTLETDGGLWVSEQMIELLSIARRIAPADITVLLTGETGTGKEILARAIHRASARAAKPFVPFNVTAVPREMLESQLFGYRRGAFTGADNAFDGVIRAASGGTLFLDEVAEIGPELQPKLLRFLETREVHGLGEAQPVKVDVRIIAATNADLETLVAANRFREDLFYRLNVARLRLPPLRERREEIPPLIDHYLGKFAEEQKKGRLSLDDETLEYLVLYGWPGNVRQLVNEISRLVAYAEVDGTVTPALLSPDIQASRRTVRVLPGDEPELRVRLDQPMNAAIEALERMMVLRALERAHGNYESAAKLLGISRKGLFLKRRRWGLKRAS